jgi:HprK-related kinase A
VILADLNTPELLDRLAGDGLWLRTGPFTCAIRTTIGSVAEGLRRLYADFPLVEQRQYADFHIALLPKQGIRRWLVPTATFSFDGLFSYEPFALSLAPAYFEWGLNCCISRNVHHLITMHGAVVERAGKAVIVLGDSGAGKSTLCAAMVADGWRLLTDELALVDPHTLEVSPIVRPISLKNRSIDLVRQLCPDAVFGLESYSKRKGRIVHMKPPRESVLRANEKALPTRVLFVDFQPAQTETLWTEIEPAEAHLRVAQQSFNYGLLGETGFDALSRLMVQARCFDFSYGNLPSALNALASDAFFGE